MPEAVQFDTTIKDLFRMKPQVFMRMVAGGAVAEFLPTEFRSTRWREPDLLMRLDDSRLVQIELQTRPRRIEQRMFSYRAEIRERYKEPLLQLVLYLGQRAPTAACSIVEADLEFRFHALCLRELDAEPLLNSSNVADKVLALLCRIGDPRVAARTVAQAVRTVEAPADLREQLLVISSLRQLESLIREELDMPITIQEIPILRDAYESGKKSGHEEGREEGRQEGRRQQALVTARRQLARRFGRLTPAHEQFLDSATLEQLDNMLDRILTASTLDELLDSLR